MVPNIWVAWYYTIERFWTTRVFFFSFLIPQVDLRREGGREETFVEKEETFVEKGNEKFSKVGLYPSVEFWIL
jgi:hypothetical protein